MLRLQNIKASYHPGNQILRGIDLVLNEGEKVVILGRNGAGKTTLANAIFGLVPHIDGEVSYRGKNILNMPPENISSAGIGYFMQGAPVFPQLSIRENLQFASKSSSRDLLSRITALGVPLPILDNQRSMGMPAGNLSGGERTQLAIAMAILDRPGLLILDEPFAGLSPSNTALVLRILQDYHSHSNASMILIAQDRFSAARFSDEQLVLRNGKLSQE